MKELPHRRHYYKKLFRNVIAASIVLIVSLTIGTIGYHFSFGICWVDSFYNASLILTGMGPVDKAPNDVAKIFASIYSIYSGVAFLSMAAVIFGPIFHRYLHKFHLDIEE